MKNYILYTDAYCEEEGKFYGKCSSVFLLMTDKGDIVGYEVFKKDHITVNQLHLFTIGIGLERTAKKSDVHIFTSSQYAMNVLSGKWKIKANLDIIDLVKKDIQDRHNVSFEFWKHEDVKSLYHSKTLKSQSLPKPTEKSKIQSNIEGKRDSPTSSIFKIEVWCKFSKNVQYIGEYHIYKNNKVYCDGSVNSVIPKPIFTINAAVNNAIDIIPEQSEVIVCIHSKVQETNELAVNKFTSENILSLYCDRYRIKVQVI